MNQDSPKDDPRLLACVVCGRERRQDEANLVGGEPHCTRCSEMTVIATAFAAIAVGHHATIDQHADKAVQLGQAIIRRVLGRKTV